MNTSYTSLPLLTIWAHSFCRSTLATYLSLASLDQTSVEIVMCGKIDPELRAKSGFDSAEFTDAKFVALQPTIAEAISLLKARPARLHMFTAYHGNTLFQALLDAAVESGISYFIGAEAPQNMEKTIFRRVAKEIYIPTILHWRVKRSIACSRFFVCYSGLARRRLRQVGWPDEKIEAFGYYPPSLCSARPDLALPERPEATRDEPLHFLATGTHCRHKSPKTLVEAAALLKDEGLGDKFRCTIAGRGMQTAAMQAIVRRKALPVAFPGFVKLETLMLLYRTADVFVGTGIEEPWGIRVNDAIQLGCPTIISTGMGAHSDIRDHSLGWIYSSGSAQELARVMRSLIEDRRILQRINQRLVCNDDLSPPKQSKRLLEIIERGLGTKAV